MNHHPPSLHDLAYCPKSSPPHAFAPWRPPSIFPAATPETAPTFEWAQPRRSGPKNEKTRSVTLDREGNIFLAGEATDEVKFGDITVKSAGGMDFFVAKLDPKGHFLWARLGGGSLIDRGYAVAADAAGNCYVTGHYQSTDADFSGTKLPNRGDYDIFVAKYDRDGNLARGFRRRAAPVTTTDARHRGGRQRRRRRHEGAVVGDSEFGDVKIPNEPGSHIFCAKYHPDGKLVWVKVSTGNHPQLGAGQAVVVDGKGAIYIGGDSYGSGQFGDKPRSACKSGSTSSLVAKLSPEGEEVLWLAQDAGEPSCLFRRDRLTCDTEGRVWASGMFKGKTTVGSETYHIRGRAEDNEALLCHYDTDVQTPLEPRGAGGPAVGQSPVVHYGLGVATDGKGNSFLTGEFTEPLLSRSAAKNCTAGGAPISTSPSSMKRARSGGSPSRRRRQRLTLTPSRATPQGNLFLGGSFGGTAKFDDVSITSVGGNDLYVAKLKAK